MSLFSMGVEFIRGEAMEALRLNCEENKRRELRASTGLPEGLLLIEEWVLPLVPLMLLLV